MNIDSIKYAAEKAANKVADALLNVRDLVPQVDRVCPQTGTRFRNECDEWFDVYYSSGAVSARKWAAFVKVAPEAAAKVQHLVDAAVVAKAEYKTAQAAAKAAKTARLAEKAAKAEYKAKNGARPLEKSNSNAASNYDLFHRALVGLRFDFIAAVREAAAKAASDAGRVYDDAAAYQAAEAEFDSYLAKLATKITARISSVVSLEGTLWNGSVLTVATDAGRQTWSTTCVRNARYGCFSANGRYTPYYQWPTVQVA
jgi:hypothetical protein